MSFDRRFNKNVTLVDSQKMIYESPDDLFQWYSKNASDYSNSNYPYYTKSRKKVTSLFVEKRALDDVRLNIENGRLAKFVSNLSRTDMSKDNKKFMYCYDLTIRLLMSFSIPLEALNWCKLDLNKSSMSYFDYMTAIVSDLAYPCYSRDTIMRMSCGLDFVFSPFTRCWFVCIGNSYNIDYTIIRACSFKNAFAKAQEYALMHHLRTFKEAPNEMTISVKYMTERAFSNYMDRIEVAMRRVFNTRAKRKSNSEKSLSGDIVLNDISGIRRLFNTKAIIATGLNDKEVISTLERVGGARATKRLSAVIKESYTKNKDFIRKIRDAEVAALWSPAVKHDPNISNSAIEESIEDDTYYDDVADDSPLLSKLTDEEIKLILSGVEKEDIQSAISDINASCVNLYNSESSASIYKPARLRSPSFERWDIEKFLKKSREKGVGF